MAGPSILFLDVDGVLNSVATFKARSQDAEYRPPLDPELVGRLFRVVQATGCKIVLSSTWRNSEASVEELRDAGIMDLCHEDWRTGIAPLKRQGCIIISRVRGTEIAEWLSRHPEVETYAIVDDDSDMLPNQRERFVQTSFHDGLLDEHADRLIALLDSRGSR